MTLLLRLGRGLLRWVVLPLATVVVSTFIMSAALAASPGDPVSHLVGNRPTQEMIQAVRHDLGLDQSFLSRYWHWLTGAPRGELGISVVSRGSVAPLLAARVGPTGLLVGYTAFLIVTVGIGLGIVGAVFRPLGPIVAGMTGIGIAIPAFVAAQLLVTVFALKLGWFPAIGSGSGLADRLWHLTLPAISLATGWGAYVAQITGAAIRDEVRRAHVETSLGRGLSPVVVFRRHVLRNAAIPIVTTSGLAIAALIAGAVVVETAFGLSGLGSLLVSSVIAKDNNVVLAVGAILILVFVVVTTVTDLLQRALDPRMRVGGAG